MKYRNKILLIEVTGIKIFEQLVVGDYREVKTMLLIR